MSDQRSAQDAGRVERAEAATQLTTSNEPADQLERGTVLFGEYEILGVLGTGGMGEVFSARHRTLDEPRAIKMMRAGLRADERVARFFDREAKALLSVGHPAVVRCHDLLSDAEGRVYLIMELIEGIALSQRIEQGPMAESELRVLAARLAAGLREAHRAGVVHRDLAPDNIILPGGRPEDAKIIDFGIAKVLEAGQETIVDGFKGKFSYASPEQLGFHGGVVDQRSDYYSLGLVLASTALGRSLEMGRTIAEAVEARSSFAGLPSSIPASIRRDLDPLLRVDPEERPRSLDYLIRNDPQLEIRGSDAVPTTRSPWFGVAAAVAGAIVVVGGVVWNFGGEAPQRDPGEVRVALEAGEPTGALEQGEVIAPASSRPPANASELSASDRLKSRLKLQGLLGAAERALGDDRLSSPAGDNAVERYQAVLAIDPANAAAQAGLEKVAERYAVLARSAEQRGDRVEAQRLVDLGLVAVPGSTTLLALRTGIDSP